MRLFWIFFLLTSFCLSGIITAAGRGKDNILEQQSELEKIEQEVKRSKARLDSLKNAETKTQRAIAEHDQKITSNSKIIRRLGKQLSKIQSTIGKVQSDLGAAEVLHDRTKRRFLGSLRQFYMRATRDETELWMNPAHEIVYDRQIVYLAALTQLQSDQVAAANDSLGSTIKRLDDLSGEQKKITALKKKKEVSSTLERSRRRKGEKDLAKVRRKKAAEGDHMLTLEQSAQEMEALITRLEREREKQLRAQAPSGPSAFATLKGQLMTPCRGKVVKSYGNHVDPVTKLTSFSPGISIKSKPGIKVRAVASGSVAYVGNLRGYGNFVILNHDGRYYSTYAGLGKMTVSNGQYVRNGDRIGTVGSDGLIKFELRDKREPIDPIEWIRFDSF